MIILQTLYSFSLIFNVQMLLRGVNVLFKHSKYNTFVYSHHIFPYSDFKAQEHTNAGTTAQLQNWDLPKSTWKDNITKLSAVK